MKANLVKKIEQTVDLDRGQIFENTFGDKYLLVPPKEEEWVLINLSTGRRYSESKSIRAIKEDLEDYKFTYVGNLSDFELVEKEV